MSPYYYFGGFEPLIQVIAFFLAWVGCWLPLAIVCANVLDWQPPKPLTAEQKLPLLASLYLTAPMVIWGANQLLGASFSDYGFTWNLMKTFSSFSLGFGLALVDILALFSCQTALGWVTWQPLQPPGSLFLLTLLLFWITGTEELIFRGLVLTLLQQEYQIWVAAVISSLIFALLHLVWEQSETIPQLPGLWILGMLMVLARYVDGGSLGLAWGLHAGLVWAITVLDSTQAIKYAGVVPDWITGKAGKPLAGAVGVVCLLLIGAVLYIFSFLPQLF